MYTHTHTHEHAQVIPVEEDYEIGEELGKGQFSRVCLCVNKRTLQRKAVKIIEKDTMDAEEREVSSTVFAVLIDWYSFPISLNALVEYTC
jgi:serine/threonine protein kinase